MEARLSNAAEWRKCSPKGPVRDRVVPESVCEAAIIERPKPCWHFEHDADSARWALSFQPHCTNGAIAVLQRYARTDAKATSDLAAAFYLRAQREDEPADLLLALEQADAAIIANSSLPEARFNRALILEALAVPDEAVAAWDEFIALGDGQWREEAIARRNRLKSGISDLERWNRAREKLAAALRARDLETVKQLIDPFPAAAHRYFEDELLLQWARDPTAEHVAQLSLFAGALSQRLGDPFAVHAVNAIARSKDSSGLRQAHRTYAELRGAGLPLSQSNVDALFARAGSPFELLTRIRKVQPLAEEAQALGYRYLAATAHWSEGYLLSRSQFIPSLDAYGKARAAFASMRDYEGLTAIHTRLGGVYGALGDRRSAWRETFYAQQHQNRLIHPIHRTAHSLEIALAARKLGHEALALDYLNRHIAEVERHGGDLSFALRHRAQTFMDIGDMNAATRDVDRLLALPTSKRIDKDMAAWLQARKAELLGQQALHDRNWDQAIHQFSVALDRTPTIFTTLQALLYTERAEAHESAGNVDEALHDLEAAVAALHGEAATLLAQRELSEAEKVWQPYFDRFQDTYRALIRLRMTRGEVAEAFAYAERARATEPLDLVGRGATNIPELQQKLPRDTFILEYCVLEDRTYAWLIGRERREHFTIAIGRTTIEGWREQLQNAVEHGLIGEFDETMRTAYGALVADALKFVPRGSRLVIVPDGPLHALPFAAFRSAGHEYLVKRNTLEFSGSAALYLYSLDRDGAIPRSANPSVLAIGNPAFDSTLPFAYGLGGLEYAEREAIAVRGKYSDGDELIGRNATVPAFLAKAPHYDVIHVAAHAVVNAEEPSQSALLFAPSPGHRGALQPMELLSGLKLDRTRLVVLAVCNGIGGTPVGSEGVGPLVRPILAAGAPAVLGSLWSVRDNATTEELMVSLHAQYTTGSDAATALRKAQVDAIDKSKAVTAWAGFQVIGHASSPFAPRAPAQGGTSIGIHSSNSLQRSDRLRPQ